MRFEEFIKVFEKDLMFSRVDDDHFKVTVFVTVSPQFFAWVFGSEDLAETIGPSDVR